MIMASVRLPRKETRLLEADIRKGIIYLTGQSLSLDQAFQRIGDDIFGSFYVPPNSGEWYPLDSAAKVYPLSMTPARMSMFRVVANMSREVVPEMLQLALHATIKRFPTFATTLKRGVFWHYLDARRKRFVIEKEILIPCSPIKVNTVHDQVFRLVYFRKRISLELFHCVADGYGGMMFLRTLLAEYLRLLGEPQATESGILDITEPPRPEETEDGFLLADPNVESSEYGNGRAIQIKGKRARIQPAQIIHFRMPATGLVQASKKLQTSVTGFLLSSMFMAAKAASRETEGVFRIQVPVNMRQYYPSPTLRNFSMYAIISIPFDEVTTIEDIASEVEKQLKEKTARKPLDRMIAGTLNLVRNPVLQRTPLSLKGLIISRITSRLTRKSFTAVLSNLGSAPGSFGPFVESFEAVCGPSTSNQLGCGIITYGDTAVFSITKPTDDRSFESALYKLFTASGLDVTVSGSHSQ